MVLPRNKNLKAFSRQLRSWMTDAENLLWSRLRRKQINNAQFYRQRIIGDYIADFYCPSCRLVVELDGGQHYTQEGRLRDSRRDQFMKEHGLAVLRFSDRDVFENTQAVLESIHQEMQKQSPSVPL